MSDYRIEFNYTAPFWGELTLEGFDGDEADAHEQALKDIGMSYPEAEVIDITKVEKIN